MRPIVIVFYSLLAIQAATRLFRPSPAPQWSRIVILVTAVGIIACLLFMMTADWRKRRRGAGGEPTGGAGDAG